MWLVNRTWWADMLSLSQSKIKDYHLSHGDENGMPLGDLRLQLENQLPGSNLFDVLVEALCSSDFQRASHAIRHRDHRPSLAHYIANMQKKDWSDTSRGG